MASQIHSTIAVTTCRLMIFVVVMCGIISPHATLYAQEEITKEKKRENVFLHPKKFYKKYFPHLKIKRDPPDSTYIRVYPNYLSISAHMLSPAIGMDIGPDNTDAKDAM